MGGTLLFQHSLSKMTELSEAMAQDFISKNINIFTIVMLLIQRILGESKPSMGDKMERKAYQRR